jgi:DNA-binding Lrp family transcriptional regulator
VSGHPSDVNTLDLRVQRALQDGLPIVEQPYLSLAHTLGATEAAVVDSIKRLQQGGMIKRFGMVVRHRELGYRANAMVVWDVADDQVAAMGSLLGSEDCVTLSYRRPRRGEDWPYNLFCMIHGKSRDTVLKQLQDIIQRHSLQHLQHQVLFSQHCFKQKGAVYV